MFGMQVSRPPSRSITVSISYRASASQLSIAGEMNRRALSSIWNRSIRRQLSRPGKPGKRRLPRLSDLRPEVLDRLDQPFFELHFRLPVEERPGAGDVRAALLRVVGRQRPVD